MLVEILLHGNVVARLNSFAGFLHLFRVEHEGWSVADHFHDKAIGRLLEGTRQILERLDLLAVNLIDNRETEWTQIGIDRIRQNVRQNDDFGMFAINLLAHEKIESVADAQVADAVGLEKIERHRLENETAINHIARPNVVTVPCMK